MNDARTTGLTLVAVGVLLVVLSNVLDLSDAPTLVLSIGGALLTVVGAIVTWRTRPTSQ